MNPPSPSPYLTFLPSIPLSPPPPTQSLHHRHLHLCRSLSVSQPLSQHSNTSSTSPKPPTTPPPLSSPPPPPPPPPPPSALSFQFPPPPSIGIPLLPLPPMPFFRFPPSQSRPPPTPITTLHQHSQTLPNNSLIRTVSFKPYTIPTPTSASPSTITATLVPISSTLMAKSTEEQLKPLFDYHHDCSDSSPAFSPKRRRHLYTAVDKNEKFIEVVDCEDKEEDDWLSPPPKVSDDTLKLGEDSTIKELRVGIYIWGITDPFDQEPIKKLFEQKDWRYTGIHALAIYGTGHLYTGSGDKSIKAWSLQDYSLSCTMNGHKSVVSTLAVCNGVLYSGS
ncbi:hypothetical protein LOK49_LG05G01283 [Camellia lanceoleosa]|uniref:Uncharacterized protein n=1 Tax=Camellia lanceoleosa TaxID=1840588 RepID=A0ACC0HPQ1_9ERIC|nr:hypothetical protein LOK49_LG05G01283 [Camellia lanceoleosa]